MRTLGLVLRPETKEDVPFLRDLYLSVRWPELEAVPDWTDQHKVAFLDQQFAAQYQHYNTAYHDAAFLIVERAFHPIGRLYLFRNRRDIRVVDISLLPEARGHGLGTALLQALFAEGSASNRGVSVHVETFNPAQTLYQRLGFIKIGDNGPYHLMEWRPEQPAAAPDA